MLLRTTEDLQRILAFPRIQFGQWPTPIERVAYGGNSFLIKRDDLSGFGRGGAKTRKIEHVLGLMQAGGCNELITVIGNITNLGFDVIPALRAQGFSWRIFVQNDPPLPHHLRTELFREIEADVRFLGKSRLFSTIRVAAEWLRRRAAGRKPFLLLPGASHPAAVIGNACGFIEMVQQRQSAGEPQPEKVFVSVATGTTLAGFLLAENALRLAGADPIQIVGVQVYPGDVARRTRLLLRWTEKRLGLEHPVDAARIEIQRGALDGGFGCAPMELDGVCHRVRAQTGLQLDPIFGGKTWSVMAGVAPTEPSSDRPLMFWHCGHTPGWEALMQAVRSNAMGTTEASAPDGIVGGKWTSRKLAIVGMYAAVFYGALPLFLWWFGRSLDQALALPPLRGVAVTVLGAASLLAGLALVLSSTVALFRVGKGLPISHLPPSQFVKLGSYAWTRHPHYVGYTLAFVGWGLLRESLGHAVGAGLLLLGLWLLYVFVFEEPRLLHRFGRRYARYRTTVGVLPLASPGRAFRALVLRLRAPLEALANRLVLFRTGPILWATYGLFAALGGTLMALGLACFLLDHGWSGPRTCGAIVLVTLAITLISRVAWFVIPGDKPAVPFLEMVHRVGFVSWGGYIAAFTTATWLGSFTGLSPLRMFDVVMITGLFASAVSRWGCLAYGCCIGRCADWGLRWTETDAWIHRLRPGSSEPRIPTQLLSSLHAGTAALMLLALALLRPSSPGALAALGGLFYALPRFGVEHLREEARFGRWQLTVGQVGCAVTFLLSIVVLYFAHGAPAPFWLGNRPFASWPWLFASAGASFAILFLAYGPHWKRIGRW